MRRSSMLLLILSLIVPVLFLGCSGDDGSIGAAGAPGAPGNPGTPGPPGPGAQANETCVVCHDVGKIADLVVAHARRLPANQGTVSNPTTINSVTFGAPVGDNVPITVNFTFSAINSAGVDITSSINLTEDLNSDGNLDYVRVGLAKLVPGTNGGSDEWNGYLVTPTAAGSGPYLSRNGTLTLTAAPGTYSYTFPANAVLVSDGYVDNAVHRVAIQLSGFLAGTFNPDTTVPRPVGNIIADMVNPVGGGTVLAAAFIVPAAYPAGYPRKDVVTTAACNACHDPLSEHGSRRDTKFCVVCHNAKTETVAGSDSPGGWDNVNLVNLVHKIHNHQTPGAQNIGELGDFSEVTYPQDIRNCTRCHQGGANSGNWNTRPTRVACGSCHINVNFATGQGHSSANFAQADDSGCAVSFCHGSATLQPSFVHRTENVTPNNPNLPVDQDYFEYNITSVTVDTDNVTPVVKFWIKRNGSFLTIPVDNTGKAIPPSGYSTNSSPSFLVAWALTQDNVATPADYNNLLSPQAPSSSTGNGAGQPPSAQLSRTVSTTTGAVTQGQTLTGTSAEYTVKLTGAKFPAGAKMRAVALQGYFTQIVGTDNVARHTISVVRNVTGDTVRRTIVKGGYVDNVLKPVPVYITDPALIPTAQPWGCMECHEIFEGHGGNRVNNVQVCVMCHNPNLSTSGRTLNPATVDNAVKAVLGPDPLTYPEASNNMKSLIHGIHAAPIRANPFEFVRNRSNGFYYNWSEVTYPGTLNNCQKCHLAGSYDPNLPAGQLLSTERTTTGNPAETRAQIIAARGNPTTLGTMNSTDLVNTPVAAACVYCHDDSAQQSHFLLNGASLFSTRAEALLGP